MLPVFSMVMEAGKSLNYAKENFTMRLTASLIRIEGNLPPRMNGCKSQLSRPMNRLKMSISKLPEFHTKWDSLVWLVLAAVL